MAQGEKKYSHQSRHGGWQMRGKTCRETCGPFILVSGRFCFMCTRVRNPSSSERREQAGGPSAFPGGEGDKEKNSYRFLPVLPIPSGWQVTQGPGGRQIRPREFLCRG